MCYGSLRHTPPNCENAQPLSISEEFYMHSHDVSNMAWSLIATDMKENIFRPFDSLIQFYAQTVLFFKYEIFI